MSLKIGICVNHYYPSIGGAEIVVQTITEHLAQHHEVFVFTRKLTQKRDSSDFDYPVFEYRPTDFIGFDKKVKSLSLDYMFVYSDVFDFFREIITSQRPYKLILALCGANWIYRHRNFVTVLYRNARNIEALICHSKKDRDYRICDSPRIKDKTVIIPNGVWLKEFDDNSLSRQDLDPDVADRRWILNVSNFFPGKGQEHLIKIIGDLPDPEQVAYIQVSSDIDFAVGKQLEGYWRLSTKKLKEKGVAVRFMKNIEREKVIGFFKQSNVFAFPSEKEVAPIVLLESMASSLPWVSTNVGNATDLQGGEVIPTIKDSRAYSVFDRRTCVKFVDSICRLWNNPDVGNLGRQQIENELNWDRILPQYLALFKE